MNANSVIDFLIWAPNLIYLFIIVYTLVLTFRNNKQRRGRDYRSIAAILLGLLSCPLTAVVFLLGKLEVPTLVVAGWSFLLTILLGMVFGIFYARLANKSFDNIDRTISANMFIVGSIASSSVSWYFYIFHKQIQTPFIGIAWGFIAGLLLYAIFFGGKSNLFSG